MLNYFHYSHPEYKLLYFNIFALIKFINHYDPLWYITLG